MWELIDSNTYNILMYWALLALINLFILTQIERFSTSRYTCANWSKDEWSFSVIASVIVPLGWIVNGYKIITEFGPLLLKERKWSTGG